MRKLGIVLGSMLLLTSHIRADYTQVPGHFGGFVSDSFSPAPGLITIAVADDFVLVEETSIVSVGWWGSAYDPAIEGFAIRIFEDNNQQPGALLFGFDPAVVSATPTGQFLRPDRTDLEELFFSVDLPVTLDVQSGARYWLSITKAGANSWLWEVSAAPANTGVMRTINGGAWEPYYDNTAFTLVTIPEPSSLLLVFVGALGVLWAKRRVTQGSSAGRGGSTSGASKPNSGERTE